MRSTWCGVCCAVLKKRGRSNHWGEGRGRSGRKEVVPLKRGNKEGKAGCEGLATLLDGQVIFSLKML
jgi:hypothetical protein